MTVTPMDAYIGAIQMANSTKSNNEGGGVRGNSLGHLLYDSFHKIQTSYSNILPVMAHIIVFIMFIVIMCHSITYFVKFLMLTMYIIFVYVTWYRYKHGLIL